LVATKGTYSQEYLTQENKQLSLVLSQHERRDTYRYVDPTTSELSGG